MRGEGDSGQGRKPALKEVFSKPGLHFPPDVRRPRCKNLKKNQKTRVQRGLVGTQHGAPRSRHGIVKGDKKVTAEPQVEEWEEGSKIQNKGQGQAHTHTSPLGSKQESVCLH